LNPSIVLLSGFNRRCGDNFGEHLATVKLVWKGSSWRNSKEKGLLIPAVTLFSGSKRRKWKQFWLRSLQIEACFEGAKVLEIEAFVLLNLFALLAVEIPPALSLLPAALWGTAITYFLVSSHLLAAFRSLVFSSSFLPRLSIVLHRFALRVFVSHYDTERFSVYLRCVQVNVRSDRRLGRSPGSAIEKHTPCTRFNRR